MLEFAARLAAGPTAGLAHLKPDALTIVWARRFAEYKRAGLIARDLPRLANLMATPDSPVQLIIAGKAHPQDEGGKRMMQQLLTSLAEDPTIAVNVVFVPDYNIKVGKYLAQGADLWLNTPRKPLEASGTSGMKSSDNGGLQLTVRDGWADEVEWYETGWGIEGRNDEADAAQLYEFLEQSIIPTFYSVDGPGIPDRWIAMMKNTMIVTLSRYSMRRMVLEYVYKLYMPLADEPSALARPCGMRK
jgi:starch phosphorylase